MAGRVATWATVFAVVAVRGAGLATTTSWRQLMPPRKHNAESRRASDASSSGGSYSSGSSRSSRGGKKNKVRVKTSDLIADADQPKTLSAGAFGSAAAVARGQAEDQAKKDRTEFSDWLEAAGLSKRQAAFEEEGYGSRAKIAALSAEHLDDVCADIELDKLETKTLNAALARDQAEEYKGALAAIAEGESEPTVSGAAAAESGSDPGTEGEAEPEAESGGVAEPEAEEEDGGFDPELVTKMKKLFIKLDADASGSLTSEELRAGLTKVFKGKISGAALELMILEADQDGDGEVDYEEFMALMESRVKKANVSDADLALPIGQRMRLAINKVTLVTGVAAKRAFLRLRGIDPDAVEIEEEWPEWKQAVLVDVGDSIAQRIKNLPELKKPREPFDIFRAKTIRKLHDRNPTMEYSYLKEKAEEMWTVLYEHEKKVYEVISNAEKDENARQLEEREILDYAQNVIGIVDPRYLWVAEQGWRAPLPSEDWIVCKDNLDDQERVYYYDTVNDISQWNHPLDEYYRNVAKQEKVKLFNAVARVQGQWRGIKHRKNKEIMQNKILMFRTATKIQAVYRGRQQRRKNASTIKIQRVFRGYRIRWRVWLRKEAWAASYIGGAWRAKMARRIFVAKIEEARLEAEAETARRIQEHFDYVKLWNVAVRMQRKYREKLAAATLEEWAICKLQANFRGNRIRRQIAYAMREAAKKQREEAEAAGGVVNKVKIRLTGLTSISEINAAEKKEAGFAGPAKAKQATGEPEIDINDIIGPGMLIPATIYCMKLQAAYRRKIRRRKLATLMQSHIRRFLARRRVHERRCWRAAIKLQAVYRGWQGREMAAEMEEAEWAALVFQAGRRAYKARAELHKRRMMRASGIVQRVYRGQRVRRALGVRFIYIHAASVIQACWRANRCRLRTAWFRWMAIWMASFTEAEILHIRRLQSAFRGKTGRQQMMGLKEVVERARAATVIAKYVRGGHCRRRVRKMKRMHDWAWSHYRSAPAAPEKVYRQMREVEEREQHSQEVTKVYKSAGGTAVRTYRKRPVLTTAEESQHARPSALEKMLAARGEDPDGKEESDGTEDDSDDEEEERMKAEWRRRQQEQKTEERARVMTEYKQGWEPLRRDAADADPFSEHPAFQEQDFADYLATAPVTPAHLLLRAARDDGFVLPAIADIRSHSPQLANVDQEALRRQQQLVPAARGGPRRESQRRGGAAKPSRHRPAQSFRPRSGGGGDEQGRRRGRQGQGGEGRRRKSEGAAVAEAEAGDHISGLTDALVGLSNLLV